jgi:translocator protein
MDTTTPGRTAALAALAGFVGAGLLVGAVGGAITAPAIATWYATLRPAPGTPPNWVFAPVWSTLYVLSGLAAWLVWRQPATRTALTPWYVQLALNFLWTPAFFGLHNPAAGLAVIVPLLAVLAWCLRAFAPVPLAAWLMAPCFAWVGYATWLNAACFYLNPS